MGDSVVEGVVRDPVLSGSVRQFTLDIIEQVFSLGEFSGGFYDMSEDVQGHVVNNESKRELSCLSTFQLSRITDQQRQSVIDEKVEISRFE